METKARLVKGGAFKREVLGCFTWTRDLSSSAVLPENQGVNAKVPWEQTAPQAWNVLKGLCRGNIAFLPPPQSVRISLSGFVKEAWFPSNNFLRIKRICTRSICPTLHMGELKVVYKLPELGWFGSAGHRLKDTKDWGFQTAPIPKHRGTARLIWNWNKTFLGKVCISGPVYSLGGINGHVPTGLVVVSSLTQWVKPRFGQSLIAV